MRRFSRLALVIWLIGSLSSCAEVPEVEDSPEAPHSVEAVISNPEVFWAQPAVIQSCDDDVGSTTLNWKVPTEGRFEIHVDSPDGPIFALVNPEGSKATEEWVKDGTSFFLVPEGGGEIVASVTLRVTKQGC